MQFVIRFMAALCLLFVTLNSYSHDGIFFTVEGGWASPSDMPSSNEVGAFKVNSSNFPVFRASLGYMHDFTPYYGLGIEAGFADYGNYDYYAKCLMVNTQISTTEFLVTNEYHINSQYDFYVKIGGIRNTFEIISNNKKYNEEHTKIQPMVVVGGNYNITPHVAITVSYSRSFGETIHSLTDRSWVAPSINTILTGLRITSF